ncbi:hypothetical protein ACVD67_18195 [Klebsiella quasipneumoniae]
MTTSNISKSSILSAAMVVSADLESVYSILSEAMESKRANGNVTKKDTADLKAAFTKMNWFNNHIVGALNDAKLSGVFYFVIKATKQDPELLFREAMENSYSLEKLVYLVSSIAKGKCQYSLADKSASRVFLMTDLIADEMEVFTLKHLLNEMNSVKQSIIDADANSTLKLDAGYTQVNQLTCLFERLGLIEKVKGSGVVKNGSLQYRFIKNDFYNYLKESFSA